MQLYAEATKKCSSTFDSVLFCSCILVKNIGLAMSLNIREPMNRITVSIKNLQTHFHLCYFNDSTTKYDNTLSDSTTITEIFANTKV